MDRLDGWTDDGRLPDMQADTVTYAISTHIHYPLSTVHCPLSTLICTLKCTANRSSSPPQHPHIIIIIVPPSSYRFLPARRRLPCLCFHKLASAILESASSSSLFTPSTTTTTAFLMSFLYNSTYPKVRQEGFHLNSGAAQATGGQQSQQQQQQQQSLGHLQPHPTPTTFDPNSLYTTGALFADAFRNPSQSQDPFRRFDNPQQQHQQHQQHQQQHQNSSGPASLDIHEELSYLNPSSTTRSVSGHSPQPPTSASEHAAPGPYSSAHDNYPKPHDIFAVNQPQLASFSLPHNRPPFSRDAFATTTTPASLHHSYGRPDFFGGHQTQQDLQRHHHDQLTPQQQQQQQQFGHLNRPLSSSGETAGIHSPLPDKFKPGGPQSPAVGPTRSRSRSRSKVSTSRTRVSKPPSLPPPDEPSGSSRGTSASRPSGIVIPGQAFTSFGAQPNSTQWFVPGDQYSAAQNGDGINGNHAYSQSFGAGSLPMGASPTTQNGGSPPTATNDAATK